MSFDDASFFTIDLNHPLTLIALHQFFLEWAMKLVEYHRQMLESATGGESYGAQWG